MSQFGKHLRVKEKLDKDVKYLTENGCVNQTHLLIEDVSIMQYIVLMSCLVMLSKGGHTCRDQLVWRPP